MHLHSVVIIIPEKPQVITIFLIYFELMKHLLYITHKCDAFLMESDDDTCQSVSQIRSLKQAIVQRRSLTLCTTVKDNSDLLWFLWVVHPMVWYVPGRFVVQSFRWDFLCISALRHFLHVPFVVFEIFLVRFEAALEMTEPTHSYISVVRQVRAYPEWEGHAVVSLWWWMPLPIISKNSMSSCDMCLSQLEPSLKSDSRILTISAGGIPITSLMVVSATNRTSWRCTSCPASGCSWLWIGLTTIRCVVPIASPFSCRSVPPTALQQDESVLRKVRYLHLQRSFLVPGQEDNCTLSTVQLHSLASVVSDGQPVSDWVTCWPWLVSGCEIYLSGWSSACMSLVDQWTHLSHILSLAGPATSCSVSPCHALTWLTVLDSLSLTLGLRCERFPPR